MAERRSNPKGAPDLGKIGVAMELGRVVELETETPDGVRHLYTWKGSKPLLLWSPSLRALVWFEGVEASGLRKGAPRTDGAAAIFEKFAEGRPAEQHRILAVPPRKPRRVGRAIRVVYTEPWGRASTGTRWEHDFAPSDVFWAADRARPFAFAVTGPRLTVTERGIVY